MLDISDLPLRDNTQVFYANYVIQTWQKPRGCKFVYIFSLGGGGGGGGGVSGAAGTNRIGAGGGGAGGFNHQIIPAIFLPDTLYILVSTGGRGGNPNSNGSGAPQSNYIRMGNLIPALPQGMSFNTPARGNPGQAGGAGGTSVGSATNIYGRSSIFSTPAIAQAGGGGGSAASGTSLNILFPVTAGAAGGGASAGGTSFAGGNINPNGFVPLIQGGQNPGDNGQNGFGVYNTIDILTSSNPFFFTGGAGGAGNATGTGGNGGKGGFGCGGGGGGAGVTGGRGGDGGDGLVIISWW